MVIKVKGVRMLSEVEKILEKQQYRMVGNHSSVKVCHWTKESLTSGRVCFKERWYPPVESHRCMEFTPVTSFCNHHCLWCWRLHSGDRGLVWDEFSLTKGKIDEPREILERAIGARKKLLSGFKGNPKVDKKKFEEALKPTMLSISLTGEPLMYPKLSELIEEGLKMNVISFLVTNGTLPEKLNELETEPFQLYITLPAPDEKTYKKACVPLVKDGWKRMNESLELMKSFDCRKVIRLTLVKDLNMKNPEKYSKLILKTNCDFCRGERICLGWRIAKKIIDEFDALS